MDAALKDLFSAAAWLIGSSVSGAILSRRQDQIRRWRERAGYISHHWDVVAKRTVYDMWMVGTVLAWFVSLFALVNSILFIIQN